MHQVMNTKGKRSSSRRRKENRNKRKKKKKKNLCFLHFSKNSGSSTHPP